MVNERLKDLRMSLGLSQKTMGEKLQIAQTTYANYETGKANIPDELKARLINQFKVNLNWLVVGQGSMYLDSKEGEVAPVERKEREVPLSDSMGKEIEAPAVVRDVTMVPLTNLKLSAGHGVEWSDGDFTGEYVPVPRRVAARYGKCRMAAATIKGDSMEPTLRNGEPVVFTLDGMTAASIYVIAIGDELLVKRLQRNLGSGKLLVISDNPKYPPMTVDADAVRILGRVVMWVHDEGV